MLLLLFLLFWRMSARRKKDKKELMEKELVDLITKGADDARSAALHKSVTNNTAATREGLATCQKIAKDDHTSDDGREKEKAEHKTSDNDKSDKGDDKDDDDMVVCCGGESVVGERSQVLCVLAAQTWSRAISSVAKTAAQYLQKLRWVLRWVSRSR